MADGQGNGWKTGCMIAAAVAAGLLIVCGGTFTYCSYKVATNPQVQHGWSVMGASYEVAQQAALAPGTRPMREAGCIQALVFSPELIERLVVALTPDGGAAPDFPSLPLLVCNAGRTNVPTCDAVVRAYTESLPAPPDEVALQLAVQGEDAPRCSGTYGPDGTFLREIDGNLRSMGSSMGGRMPPPP